MSIFGAKTARIRGSGFRAIAWIALIAFALQSFVTQTHIHGTSVAGTTLTVSVADFAGHKKPPADDGQANCPFCQAIVHAGAFSSPAAPTLALPLTWTTFAAFFFLAETFVSVSTHFWHSRAPPQR